MVSNADEYNRQLRSVPEWSEKSISTSYDSCGSPLFSSLHAVFSQCPIVEFTLRLHLLL